MSNLIRSCYKKCGRTVNMHPLLYRFAIVMIVLCWSQIGRPADNWPVHPDSTIHKLVAVYGSWLENLGYPPFMHSGIDISIPAYTKVYAAESGWIKTITDRGISTSWRIVIGDAPGTGECEAWMYAHINDATMPPYHFDQYVEAGTYICETIDMPPESYDHLHLSKIRYGGDSLQWAAGQADWVFVANPLDHLPADSDTMPPVLENALGEQLFAFCQNEGTEYIEEGAPIHGDVDIICQVHDYYNFTRFENGPYQIEYRIDGDSSIPWTISCRFSGEIGTYDEMAEYTYIVFQDDAVCNTIFIYPLQDVYYNLTNTDGDLIVEPEDKLRSWDTRYFANGEYKIVVRVSDKSLNAAVDSMMVVVENFFNIHGNITYDDGFDDRSGTIVSVPLAGLADTTDADGNFLVAGLIAGDHAARIERPGCQTIDTTLIMYDDYEIVMNDIVVEYIKGDANYDGGINIGDAVYLTNFVFNEGPRPRPTFAGDANSDGNTNVGDIVYLINFIFHDGPPPTS